MDGISMSDLHGNLHRLSHKNFKILKKYFGNATLTSQEVSSLQSEITKLAATSKEQPSHASKN
jgi:nicotinate-nucleotide pyrophosphorylase